MSKKKAASKDAMRDLHTAVARALEAGLGVQKDEAGNVLQPDPRILANAITFLKNNGIVSEDDSEEMQSIKKKMGNVIEFPYNPREATG